MREYFPIYTFCPYAGNIFALKHLTVIKKIGEYLQDWLSLLFTQLFSDFFQFDALSVETKID
jgi:hypothetical protein